MAPPGDGPEQASDSSTSVTCTLDHPFWVVDDSSMAGGVWTAARELKPGTCLLTADGDLVLVEEVVYRTESSTVYNIEVEGAHTYFVTDATVLVHNACSPGRLGSQTRLRELLGDQKLASNLRGWIQQEINRGSYIRRPPGYELAHWLGYEAKKGFSYAFSSLQEKALHLLQHTIGGY